MVAPSFWGWGSQRQKPGVASTLRKRSVAQLGGWETEALSQLRSKPLFPPRTHTHTQDTSGPSASQITDTYTYSHSCTGSY